MTTITTAHTGSYCPWIAAENEPWNHIPSVWSMLVACAR